MSIINDLNRCEDCGRTTTNFTRRLYKHLYFDVVKEVCSCCAETGQGDEWAPIKSEVV